MIIQALKVVLEEAELAAKVRDGLGAVSQLKDVTFSLVPGAVHVGGTFHVGFAIPFETQWTVDVLQSGRQLAVRLAHVSVGFFGMNAGTVSEQVMKALSEKLRGVAGVRVETDRIVLEPSVLLAGKGICLASPFTRVEVVQGKVEIELLG